MRLLLDTRIFLWVVAGSPLLKAPARRIIDSADEVFVSAASLRQIAIRARIGKIKADAYGLAAAIDESGFVQLPLSVSHAAAVDKLPIHHNGPFDHLLIAQALSEPLKRLPRRCGARLVQQRRRGRCLTAFAAAMSRLRAD